MTVELWERPAGPEGILLLPFGLGVSQGVSISVDDGPVGAAQPFYTCLSNGCLVKLDIEAGFLAALRKGKTLFVHTRDRDGKALRFAVSLAGFSAAHDRLAQFIR